MAVEEGINIPPPVLRTFKRMQDLLGLWHDYVVLTEKVLELCVDEQVSLTQPALLKNCLTFAQSSARQSESRLKEFFKLWKKQGSTIRLQILNALGEMDQRQETIAPVETEVEVTQST
jgi:hypothetical protein